VLEVQRREQCDLAELQEPQREFVREHHLPLLPAPQ
jgi:hypothetical protein